TQPSYLLPYTTLFRSRSIVSLSRTGTCVGGAPARTESSGAVIGSIPSPRPTARSAVIGIRNVRTSLPTSPTGYPQCDASYPQRRSEEHTSELQSPYDI